MRTFQLNTTTRLCCLNDFYNYCISMHFYLLSKQRYRTKFLKTCVIPTTDQPISLFSISCLSNINLMYFQFFQEYQALVAKKRPNHRYITIRSRWWNYNIWAVRAVPTSWRYPTRNDSTLSPPITTIEVIRGVGWKHCFKLRDHVPTTAHKMPTKKAWKSGYQLHTLTFTGF